MKYLLAGFLLFSVEALGCSFNTDCSIGSSCVKSGYSIYGVCVGQKYNNNPAPDRGAKAYGYGNKAGDSCSFNTDCSVGGQCLKSGYSIYGTCSK